MSISVSITAPTASQVNESVTFTANVIGADTSKTLNLAGSEQLIINQNLPYLVLIEDKDGTRSSKTVSLTVNDEVEVKDFYDPATISFSGGLLFTEAAKTTIKSRFDNGYIHADGFNNDIELALAHVDSFVADPSTGRPTFGEVPDTDRDGIILHSSAFVAYANDNVTLANTVVTEILAIVNETDLTTDFWNDSETYRWDSDYDLFVQIIKVKKLSVSYNQVEHLQDTLTNTEDLQIKAWFTRWADLAYAGFKRRLETAVLGENWDADNHAAIYTGALLPSAGGNSAPVQDAGGNNILLIGWVQDFFNNRWVDVVSYIHALAIENGNVQAEKDMREYFKLIIKYGVFSDGSHFELMRAESTWWVRGVWYNFLSSCAMIEMAHLDMMTQNYPDDLLYDYSTIDGVLNGSTTLTSTAYQGTSTTDGVTPKSLKTFLVGFSNYYRPESAGGWNDIRFSEGVALNPEGQFQPSVHVAVANLYYKDAELSQFYNYDITAGYVPKQNLVQGYLGGVGNDDMGAWGNLVFGVAWLGQENNYFYAPNAITANNKPIFSADSRLLEV